jgi:[ribosomal protein S5]-alanine N-acetyltransferase
VTPIVESLRVGDASTVDWRLRLPVLRNDRMWLREPVPSDAPAVFRELCVPEVCQYVPPPPTAVDGIERMIAKSIERRLAGQAFLFGIQPAGSGELAGILQFVSSRDHLGHAATPAVWELGFALSSRYWGVGLLGEAATMALQFAFKRVGLEAVEAWVIAENRRANRALEKLGGVPAAKPNTRAPDGRTADFVLWTLRDADRESS